MSIEDKIRMILEENPEGITAKDIAEKLGLKKGDVNPILYRAEGSKYMKLPQSFSWVLVPQKNSTSVIQQNSNIVSVKGKTDEPKVRMNIVDSDLSSPSARTFKSTVTAE